MEAVSDYRVDELELSTAAAVLIIDDETGPRESMRMLLKPFYRVHCSAGVVEALSILERETIDCVVMDIRMPGMTGIEGLKHLRNLDPDVAVIMLTGYGSLETAREAMQLGANDYLKKPFDAKEMAQVIQKNVERSAYARRKRNAELELKGLNQKLQAELRRSERMISLGQNSRELVHDLQNPLTIVMGFVNLLSIELRKLDDSGAHIGGPRQHAMDYLDIMENSLLRCRNLLETWQNMGESTASLQCISVEALLAPVMKEIRAMAQERSITLNENIQFFQEHEVMVNPKEYPRVLTNLVSNALEALPEEGGWVRIGAFVKEERLYLSVQDNGCGISEEDQQRIFQRSFTTKRDQGGCGLGLNITRRIVEQHGGQIELSSQPEKGSTFTTWIPTISTPTQL